MKYKVILLLSICNVFFMKNGNSQIIEEGTSIVTLGYGTPNMGKLIFNLLNNLSGKDNFTTTGFGPLSLKYEYMISDNVGVGTSFNFTSYNTTYTRTKDSFDLSGNLIGVFTTKYKYAAKNYSALFRLNCSFETEDENLDLYYGIGAGFRGNNIKLSSTPLDKSFSYSSNPFPIGFETSFGVRYFFTEKLGGYGEFGLGKALLQVGVCYSL